VKYSLQSHKSDPSWLSQIHGDTVVFASEISPRLRDSTYERMTPSGGAEWPWRTLLRPTVLRGPRPTSPSRDASSNWKRCPGARVEARIRVRNTEISCCWKVLLKGRGAPNKKNVSLDEKQHIEQIDFDHYCVLFFHPYIFATSPLFVMWSIMKIRHSHSMLSAIWEK